MKEHVLDYRGKMILAPMVKICTLPTRLLALEYGADIVYTEELIDWKLLRAERIENTVLDTIDYIDQTDNSLVFRTCSQEKGHLVLQIGTSDADRAVMVAKKVEQDVDGIDVNMGCPKSFSLKGGMGAALLEKPDKITEILTKLKASVKIPVTCKIRIFSDLQKTLKLIKVIEATGVDAIAVHGRTKDQRCGHPNNVETIREIVEKANVPIIANGGSSNNRSSHANTYQGIKQFWRESGAASVMVGRAAEWNTSVFRPEGKEDIRTVIDRYLFYSIKYDYPFVFVKYSIQQILGSAQDSEMGKKFLASSTMLDLCKVLNVESRYLERQKELLSKGERPDKNFNVRMDKEKKEGITIAKHKDKKITLMFLPFVRGHYSVNASIDLPKSRLLLWSREQELDEPVYEVMSQDKKFQAIVEINNEFFSSESWEKNKRFAEQAAALVAISCLKVPQFVAKSNKNTE